MFLLIPLAVAMAALAVVAFLWTVRSGQLDDIETPSYRMLCDVERKPIEPRSREHESDG